MNAGTKYFAPASISNLGIGTAAISYAVETFGVELVFRIVTDQDEDLSVDFKGIKGDEIRSTFLNYIETLYNDFPWRESRKYPVHLSIINKIPKGVGLDAHGPIIASFLVALNTYNKRPFEQRDLYDFARNSLSDVIDASISNSLACSLIGGMVVGFNGASIQEYQRISFPQGFASVMCYNKSNSKYNSANDSNYFDTDNTVNLATQLALIFYKSNLDSFVALYDRLSDSDKLSLDVLERKFYDIATEQGVNALFRPSLSSKGLVALAINSFKASELTDIFNATQDNDSVHAVLLKHNHEGVYKY
jgi:hypothetical protein